MSTKRPTTKRTAGKVHRASKVHRAGKVHRASKAASKAARPALHQATGKAPPRRRASARHPVPPRPPRPGPDPAARGDFMADSVAATSVLDLVKYDEHGLVPVVAQEEDGTVLMVAWANQAALTETLTSGRGTYWSRSRQELWRKGDTSGHLQEVSRIAVDCDGDTVLYTLRQTGPACHTGARSCFFTSQEIPWPTSASSPSSGAP